jgi:hypothetical protein
MMNFETGDKIRFTIPIGDKNKTNITAYMLNTYLWTVNEFKGREVKVYSNVTRMNISIRDLMMFARKVDE